MNITLKPEQEQFIQSQIERGIFANPEQAKLQECDRLISSLFFTKN